jgi:hypothetical protein
LTNWKGCTNSDPFCYFGHVIALGLQHGVGAADDVFEPRPAHIKEPAIVEVGLNRRLSNARK